MNKYIVIPVLTASVFIAGSYSASAQDSIIRSSPKPTPDISCVKRVVDVREEKLGANFTTFSSTVSSAYSTRRSALASAYNLTDKKARREAIRKAFADFTVSVRTARAEFRKNRDVTWRIFDQDRRNCRAQDEGTTENKSADNGVI